MACMKLMRVRGWIDALLLKQTLSTVAAEWLAGCATNRWVDGPTDIALMFRKGIFPVGKIHEEPYILATPCISIFNYPCDSTKTPSFCIFFVILLLQDSDNKTKCYQGEQNRRHKLTNSWSDTCCHMPPPPFQSRD